MTDVSTNHPSGLPYIELLVEGRKISFRRDCFGEISIHRKVNEGEWEVLAQRVRSPFVDKDPFPSGTEIAYSVELELDDKTHQYQLDVRL